MIKYLLPLVATLAAAPALAAGPLTVESSMLSLQKRAAADGTTQVSLAPAGKVVPGDKVVIRLSYRNTGSAPKVLPSTESSGAGDPAAGAR